MPENTKASEQSAYLAAGFFDPRYLLTFGDFYSRWFENVAKASQEIVEITSNRLQKEIAVWAKFASCRDSKEFAECQQKLADEFTAQIKEDAPRVSRTIASVWTNSEEPKKAA